MEIEGYNQNLKKGILPVFILFFMVMVFRVAWVTEDAFIAFRAINNFINGRGLVYNLGERVQVFTDPLYCLFLAVPAFFSGGEFFYTCITLSLVFSGITAYLVGYKLNSSVWVGAASLLILSLSIAFTEFSTSGLENSLSHLLLALFYLEFLTRQANRPTYLAFLAALAGTNRLDNLVFYLPALFYFLFRHPSKSTVFKFTLGFLPLLLWEAFSLLYYGFFLPNTAYAKLNLGIDRFEMMEQGFIYLFASITHDPVSGLMIGLLPVSGYFILKGGLKIKELVLLAGIGCKLCLVVMVGGDYMLGRFLTEASLASLMLFTWIVGEVKLGMVSHAVLGVFAVIMALAIRHSPLKSDLSYGGETSESKFEWNIEGLVAERSFYYAHLGLANRGRFAKVRNASADQAVKNGLNYELGESPVSVMGNAGVLGFYSDPALHLVDIHALCDPLLARLPLANDYYWRTGHYPRNVPEGYLETIKSGRNSIKDSSLSAYYDHLKEVISGPIFRADRFAKILGLNFGRFDNLIEDYVEHSGEVTYRHFKKFDGHYHYPLSRLQTPIPVGTDVQHVGVLKFWDHAGSVFLDVKENSHTRVWSALLANNGKTAIRFWKGTQNLGTAQAIPQSDSKSGGLQLFSIVVPQDAWTKGYDAIQLIPYLGDKRCATASWIAHSDTLTIPNFLFNKSDFCTADGSGFNLQPSDFFGIFGPYLPFPANRYKLLLDLDDEPENDSRIRVNVYGSYEDKTYSDQSKTNPANSIEVPFELKNPSPKLEFRVMYQSKGLKTQKVRAIRLVVLS